MSPRIEVIVDKISTLILALALTYAKLTKCMQHMTPHNQYFFST
jgi:hypothetical protein